MCVPGPPLFLLPALRELKGSRDLLQGGDIWPYIPDVGFRELRNARAWHLPWQKVPKYLHGKCLQRRTAYRWRQASLCQRGWEQSGWRRGAAAGVYLMNRRPPRTAPAPCPRPEGEGIRGGGPGLQRLFLCFPTLVQALSSSKQHMTRKTDSPTVLRAHSSFGSPRSVLISF